MTRNQPHDSLKAAKSLPTRTLAVGIPIFVVSLLVLSVSGYPMEEWPFVSCVLALSTFCSGMIIGRISGAVSARLNRYSYSVAIRLGADPEEIEQDPELKRRSLIAGVVILLPLGAATWGLALFSLSVVMEQIAMAPISAHFRSITLAMLIGGASLYTSILASIATFLRIADCAPRVEAWLVKFLKRWRSTLERAYGTGVPFLTINR